MIAQTSQIKQRLFDIKHGRIKEGLKIGIPEFDEHIRFKTGSFVMLIGHANVGKTTTICYLLTLWAMKHNLRFLIWSSENTADSIVRKIIEFKMGKPIHIAHEEEISKAVSWCDTYFKIIDVQDLYTYKDLLKEANAIKDAWNYDGLVIDPYNSLIKDTQLMRGVGSHEYDYQVASELRLFAKKTDTTVFLNAHGVTDAMRKTHHNGHEYEHLPRPLAMADIEGGGKWGNRADDVICIHRYTGHATQWMYTHIHVLKIKETETGGRCTVYDKPLEIRMKKNNVGFEFLGKDMIHDKITDIKEILEF
jgi:hypothetical protein